MNKDNIPMPQELKTFDFIISSGIDIINNNYKSKDFSISYISSKESDYENNKSNEDKNLFNIKSNTFYKTIEKIQSLTNKSLNDSHLEYILIGEETAKENLNLFVDYFSKSSSVRLDVYVFITKDMKSEDFIKNILTSKIDVDSRLDGLINNKTYLSSNFIIKKNIKDIMQIFSSENKTGLIPVLSLEENPIKEIKTGTGTNIDNNNKNTFGFYGLGIIKNEKLIDYISYNLVRAYIILKENLKMTDIEITGKNNNLYVFGVKNSNNKISFEFDKSNILEKVVFDIVIETQLDERITLNKENISLNKLNELQADKIKKEIEEIIKLSKKTDTDFLEINKILSVQHPYKWEKIKNNWQNIFKDIEYEINILIKERRK